MNDPIVDEVRRIRDAHAATFNYDLDAIFQDIKAQEKSSGLEYVSYPPRPAVPNERPLRAGIPIPVSQPATSSETRDHNQPGSPGFPAAGGHRPGVDAG